MTKEEAQKALENSEETYFSGPQGDSMCLDGWFTKEQLTAILTLWDDWAAEINDKNNNDTQ